MHEETVRHSIITHAANVVDKILTYIALSSGYAEMNPLLNGLIRFVGLPSAMIIAACIGAFGIIAVKNNLSAMKIVALIMLLILFWNIWILTGSSLVGVVW